MKRIVVLTMLLSVAQFGYAVSEAAVAPTPALPAALSTPATAPALTEPVATAAVAPTPALPAALSTPATAPAVTEPVATAAATPASVVKPATKAFLTKDASVNMAAIKRNPVFDERYKRLEAVYKQTLMKLQTEEQQLQQQLKSGNITEPEVYGKSQQFEYEFHKAQKELQAGAMKLEELVDEIIAEILKVEGWDGCQVQYFSYVNPARDITDRVIAKFEEKLRAEDAAEKFKKAPDATSQKTAPVAKPAAKPAVHSTEKAVKPAPKKKSVKAV